MLSFFISKITKKGDKKMSNIAIYREARHGKKVYQVSTNDHLFNNQAVNNQLIKNNENYGKENTVIFYDPEKNNLSKKTFKRDGNNTDLVKFFNEKEKKMDEDARADYKQHKLKERAENPNKKVRTVLQSKNLKREFVIAIGGDKKITNKEEFEKNILETTKQIFKQKGLDHKSLISITIHWDEKTPHAHINYNDYSYLHKTTATEFNKVRFKEGLDKKELRQLNRENFSIFQDITAKYMGMERGTLNSRAHHTTKQEHFEILTKQNEKLRQENSDLRLQNVKLQSNNEKTAELESIGAQGFERIKTDFNNVIKNNTKKGLENIIKQINPQQGENTTGNSWRKFLIECAKEFERQIFIKQQREILKQQAQKGFSISK